MGKYRDFINTKKETVNEAAKNLKIELEYTSDDGGIVDILFNAPEDSKISDYIFSVAGELASAYRNTKMTGLITEPIEERGITRISVYKK